MNPSLATIAAAALLSACSMSPTTTTSGTVDNSTLPAAVRVPEGQKLRMVTTGVGSITYECREKAAAAGQYEWAFVAPIATLYSTDKRNVGKYYAGPTWEARDGSKVTGKQLAVSPGASGNIPLQLVQTDPAMGSGTMTGVTYIQRINTKGGIAPTLSCDAASKGRRQEIAYEADYVFYGS